VFSGSDSDSKIQYVELTAANRFEALANGTVDVIIRTTTHTMERDVYQVGHTMLVLYHFGTWLTMVLTLAFFELNSMNQA